MRRDELTARLLVTFRGELDEQLRTMNEDLLALEAQPGDGERLKRLFRAAHTLKGAAHATGVSAVERTCHAMEARLSAARDGSAPLRAIDFSELFAALDTLGEEAARLAATAAPPPDRPAGPQPPAAEEPATEAGGGDAGREAASAGESVGSIAVARAERGTVPVEGASAPLRERRPPRGAATEIRSKQVRVDEQQLDAVLATAAELLTSAANLESMFAGLGGLARPAVTEARRLRQLSATMREDMRRLRMRPFAEACEPLPRLIRDLVARSGKLVRLEVSGEDVEADRAVLDALREALLHLSRNAIDHGIESPEAREAAGKPRAGRIDVKASIRGDRLVVTVADDGAGLDLKALRAQLERQRIPIPAEPRGWTRLLFGGGISSRSEATTISGRGVGLDSARAAVERVRGAIDFTWREGAGTTFVLDLPLTLAIQRLLIVSVGGHLVAFPSVDVERLEHVAAEEVRQMDGNDVLPDPEGPIRLVALARLLGPRFGEPQHAGRFVVVRLRTPQGRLALLVDALVSEEEALIHAIARMHRPGSQIAGVALAGSERVTLVLRTAAILETALHGPSSRLGLVAALGPERAPRILVVDDSITTRTLEKNVLETAGYDVTTAPDGAEAWRLLQEEEFDLVLSDVEMPRMDGFELCRAIRASRRVEQLPVVLLTALETPEQRAHGLELGADAYLVKSSFDQDELLEVIRQLAGAAA